MCCVLFQPGVVSRAQVGQVLARERGAPERARAGAAAHARAPAGEEPRPRRARRRLLRRGRVRAPLPARQAVSTKYVPRLAD